MKKYIKNVTDDNKTVIPRLKRPFTPATLAFKEDGKKIILKPGEYAETKGNGTNISWGRRPNPRLVLLTEDELKGKKKKKEVD